MNELLQVLSLLVVLVIIVDVLVGMCRGMFTGRMEYGWFAGRLLRGIGRVAQHMLRGFFRGLSRTSQHLAHGCRQRRRYLMRAPGSPVQQFFSGMFAVFCGVGEVIFSIPPALIPTRQPRRPP